ncbi:MAG: SH3 domain-containing protein [Acidimicrobiia bacterium]
MGSRSVLAVLAVSMLVLGACGEDAATSTTTTIVIETTTSSLATTTTSMATTTSATSATTTTATGTTTTRASELPGEPIDFGPAAGDTLAVVGVAHDDVLNLRAAPGADQEILDGIPPTYDALTAVGETRELPGSFWIAVDYEDTEGWVNLTFIGYLGDTTDVTHAVTEQLGGTSGAETMLELGLIVAESIAGDSSADIVMSVAPTVGDLGEVTFDVTGFEDDSVRGSRLHVFGQPIDEAFLLASVEETVICARGVDDGNCV